MPETTKIYTSAEVAQHKDTKSGVWISIHGNVYDVTKFLEEVCVNDRRPKSLWKHFEVSFVYLL